MADKSFVIKSLVLRSGRFGRPRAMVQPKDGIDDLNSIHHNVVAAAYPLGTVIELWNSTTFVPGSAATVGSEGWSEFVYGQFAKDSGEVLVAADVLMPKTFTDLFIFVNDPDVAASYAAGFWGVVAITAMTDDYYGWFWSGGVCPCDLVAGFAVSTTIATESSATAGSGVIAANLTANKLGLAIGDATHEHIGSSLVADGA